MSEGERDSTQDWQVPAAGRPVTMHELERRVDVALAVAHSAEAAAVEIGAAAIEAAEQARRAAEFAERAVSGRSEPLELLAANGAEAGAGRNGVEIPDERLCLFSERADRVMTRLRALEPVA